MEQQIEYLTRLQNIEIETRTANQRIAEISKQHAELDRQLEAFRALMDAENEQTDGIKKEYREYEVAFQDNLNLIDKSKAKLSLANNNKEYQSSLREIEELEKKNDALEDEMLEILDRIDAAEGNLKAREQEYAALKEEVEQGRRKISAEIEAKQQELAALERGLEEARGQIDPEVMATFEKAKKVQPNEIALARVVDAVCQGCNVTIPAQLYNELHRRDSIKFCPKCGRIAYWSESAR